MSSGEPFILLGGDGDELAALAATLDLHGMTFVHLHDDHRLDRTELLDNLYGGPSISDTIASLRGDGGWLAPPRADRKPYRTSGRQITFIDTPKPLSKRRARRLRGKAAATPAASREDDQRCRECGFLACICFQDVDRDEGDDAADCCMMGPDGLCGAAGSEFCDWECPTMRALDRGDLA